MFFIENYKYVYIIVSLAFAFILSYSAIYISKIKTPLVKRIFPCLFFSISSVIIYSIYLLCYMQNFARYFYSLYYIFLTLFVFSLLRFSISFTQDKFIWPAFENIFTIFVVFDVLYFIINAIVPFSFDLVEVPFKFFENTAEYENIKIFTKSIYSYRFLDSAQDLTSGVKIIRSVIVDGRVDFSLLTMIEQLIKFHKLNFFLIHITFCFVMILISLTLLLIKSIKAPFLYKFKYLAVFFTYILSFSLYGLFYLLKTEIEYTGLLVSILNFFVCYFSVYKSSERLEQKALYKISEEVPEGILCFDNIQKLIYYNQKAKEIFRDEKNKSEISQKKVFDFFMLASNKAKRFVNQCESLIWQEEKIKVDGVEHFYNVEFHQIIIEKKFVGNFIKLTDKTEDVEKIRRDEFIANHDSLTKLYNRKKFFEVAERILKNESGTQWQMMCFNIKDFKLINEIFGNRKGDELLKKYAELIQKYALKGSCYGRISDDKIAVLIKTQDFSESRYLEIIEILSKLFDNFKLSINVGIYIIKDPSERVEIMYDKAFLAISKISNPYQKTFIYYGNNSLEQMRYEKDIADKFEASLKNNEISLFLQPIVDEKGNAVSCEARARWNLNGELISAGKFIKALKNSGLIPKLDMFIWEEAAKILCDWKIDGLDDFSITINVDEKDIYYFDIANFLDELVQKHRIEPKNLIVQFKESEFVKNYDFASKVANNLAKKGFPVCITDFGGGYSSLNVIKDMDISSIKMDMVFVDSEKKSERNEIILNTIISMAKELDYNIVSKGVKDFSQVQQMSSMGFKLFQGEYFDSAIDVESFEKKYLPQLC